MNELALFAGIGGGILGTQSLGIRTVCGVEINPYCQKVLLQRQRDGILPPFPIWDDVRTFDGRRWRGIVDLLSAGFPCQPFSVAGRKGGKESESHPLNLWGETIRIIREVESPFVFLENVPGLLTSGFFPRILQDLAESGYIVRWNILSARSVGACHLRKRLWIFAHTQSKRRIFGTSPEKGQAFRYNWWFTEPGICRVDDGTPYRVDRVRACGNAQVPQVVRAVLQKAVNE